MASLLPPPVRKGGCIAVAAPSGAVNEETLGRSLLELSAMGYSIEIPKGIYARHRYLAGSDAHRADMLHRLFLDDRIDAIWCARGGYGSLRLIPHLDFDLIRRHPKRFIGFSDITILLNVLNAACRMVTFHGPVLSHLSSSDPATKASVLAAIRGETPGALASERPVVLQPGTGSGTVAGGNLSCLCHMIGTAFSPCFRRNLLFLEDCNEPAYRIDRMMTQMRLAGCFDGVSGVMVGSFEKCGPIHTIHEIISDSFADMDIPVLAGFPVGHGHRNLTLPIGLSATLDTCRNHVVFETPFMRHDEDSDEL